MWDDVQGKEGAFGLSVFFRSWDKVFCVLDGKRLAMYKDQKHAKTVSFDWFQCLCS